MCACMTLQFRSGFYMTFMALQSHVCLYDLAVPFGLLHDLYGFAILFVLFGFAISFVLHDCVIPFVLYDCAIPFVLYGCAIPFVLYKMWYVP